MTKTGFPETRSSEQDFLLRADNAPVMIWRSGPDRRSDWFNKPWLSFTGRSLEEERGLGWAEGIHPEDRDGRSAVYANAFERRDEMSARERAMSKSCAA